MQITDSNGNVYGWDGLEINGPDGKAKVPVINTDITIGTTAIVGGAVNRILFQGIGNVVQESSSFTYDDTLKKFTLTGPIGSVIQHTALTNYNGLSGFQLNVADGTERAFFKLNPSTGEIRIGGTGSGYFPTFYAQGVEAMRIFASTRNVGINTTTDAGYKTDINGTLRVQGAISIFNPAFTNGGTIAHTANSTLYITGGPGAGGENITFGPSNRIFINAQQTRFPNGSVQMSSTLTVGSGNATSTNMLLMQGSITAGSALGRGIGMDTTLVASANNDVLIGLDVNPTFTNGAFTGVSNISARLGGNLLFTQGAKTISIAAPSTSGSGGGLTISAGNANTSGTGGSISIQPGNGAGGPGAGTVIISNTSWWNGATVNGTLTVTNSGPNTGTSLQVNAGGQNALSIFWDNLTPFMQYGLVLNRQARFVNSTSYTFSSKVFINTTVDAGFNFDVNGTARINNALYITNSSYTGSIRIESIGNNQQRIYGAYGENITWGAGGNTININSGETYVSGSFLGGGFWMQNNGATVLGAQAMAAASALLDIRSTSRGFLPPRMTTTQKNAIATPASGLVIFDTTLNKLCVYTTAWETITSI